MTVHSLKRHRILIAALVLGAVLGVSLHGVDFPFLKSLSDDVFQSIGQIFLRLIFMAVVPLVFSALVLGVFELGQGQGLGRVMSRTLFFTVLASAASVVVGVGLVNLLKPGNTLPESVRAEATRMATSGSILKYEQAASATKGFWQSIVELIPQNPIHTATRALEGDMLPFMVFALLFGIAMIFVQRDSKGKGEDQTSVLLGFFQQIFATSMKLVEFAMSLAPVAVFALVFNSGFRLGLGVFQSLLYYVAVVVAGLLIQQFGVYTLLLKLFTKRSPLQFFKDSREVCLYAFSTASSNATLPYALEAAEKDLKIQPSISRFVLTVGATANQNGTALFEGVTALFLAQVYGIDLSLGQQLSVVLLAILGGIGTAGVPGGSLPLVLVILQSIGVPGEGIGLILGVDRFLDMARTTLNVSGDLVISALVAEGEKPKKSKKKGG